MSVVVTQGLVRMDMCQADADAVNESLLATRGTDIAERIKDQIWLVSLLTDQRKRAVKVSERARFTRRCNRILEGMDP